MTKAKTPYFVIQTQVVTANGEAGYTTYLQETPQEGVVEELSEAFQIDDRESGIAKLGIFSGYLGRKDARPLAEAIIGNSETAITSVNITLIEFDKADAIVDEGVARVVIYVSRSPDNEELVVQLAGFQGTPSKDVAELDTATKSIR